MKPILLALGLLAMSGTAQAQQFVPMQNDQMLIQAINEMASVLQNGCQMGSQPSCDGYNSVMGNANAMYNANMACMQGDPQACDYYGRYYAMMDQSYGAYQRQMQMAAAPNYNGGGGVNPLGATHQDRMNAIENFGAQNTQNWQSNMDQLEQKHQTFMGTITGN